MYIIGPKKDQFKLVFFGLFYFSKMKRPRPRLQKTNKQSFLVLVLFGLSPVQLQSFASPRTGLSNTISRSWCSTSLDPSRLSHCWSLSQCKTCNSIIRFVLIIHAEVHTQTRMAPPKTSMLMPQSHPHDHKLTHIHFLVHADSLNKGIYL